MTLLLEIGWTEAATQVAVVDTASHSTVGEGRADNPGAVEGAVDPDGWWQATVQATRLAVDALVALGLQPTDLRSVLLAPGDPAGGLVALGADGTPVHPALVGSHAASGPDADWLLGHAEGGADAWLAATDVLPGAGSTVALLSWLHRSAPEAWDATTRVTLPTGYLLERLGGDAAVSVHDAVGTAVLDRRSGERWCTELLAVVDGSRDWAAVLPRIALTADPVGILLPASAAELGVPAELPLHVGRVATA